MPASSPEQRVSPRERTPFVLPMHLFWSLVTKAYPSDQSSQPYRNVNGQRLSLMSLAALEITANGLELCSHWAPMLTAVMDSAETLQSEILRTCSTQCGS